MWQKFFVTPTTTTTQDDRSDAYMSPTLKRAGDTINCTTEYTAKFTSSSSWESGSWNLQFLLHPSSSYLTIYSVCLLYSQKYRGRFSIKNNNFTLFTSKVPGMFLWGSWNLRVLSPLITPQILQTKFSKDWPFSPWEEDINRWCMKNGAWQRMPSHSNRSPKWYRWPRNIFYLINIKKQCNR